MAQRLIISLTEEATSNYLKLAREQSAAMLEEGCEPSDVLLKVIIAANKMYDSDVLFGDVEIGTVSVDLVDD